MRGCGCECIELGLRASYSLFWFSLGQSPLGLEIEQVISEVRLRRPGILRGWRRLCLVLSSEEWGQVQLISAGSDGQPLRLGIQRRWRWLRLARVICSSVVSPLL